MSGKKDRSPLPRAGLGSSLPHPHRRPAHQHVVVPSQGDPGVRDVDIDPAEVESSGAASRLRVLATDLEERQVHGGVAHFHQDISAGVPDGMASAIERHVWGAVRGTAHSHAWQRGKRG